MTQQHGLSKSSIESIAGFTAGTISTLAVHPLDIIKTRLQLTSSSSSPSTTSNGTKIPSLPSLRILQTLLTREGPPLRSLYRGLTPNLLGNSLGWSLYFVWYSQAQDAVRRIRGYEPLHPLSALDYLAASLASGLLSATLTNPIWVIKTRMLSTGAAHHGAYPSMLYGLRALAREEGLRGYFRGLLPAVAGVSHGAVYFVAYEQLKRRRAEQIAGLSTSMSTSSGKQKPALSNTDYLLISGLSKVIAGTLTYPHQVIRARMQTYADDAGQGGGGRLLDNIAALWRRDGMIGFYKGLGPSLLRVVPSTCVTFLVYENVKWALVPRMKQEADGGL